MYLLRPWLQKQFSTAISSLEEEVLNNAMSAVRVSVDQSYKDLKKLWKSQYYVRNIKVRVVEIYLLYKMWELLKNLRTCL